MKNIHIICEGYEDFKYLARLKELKVFSNIYNISLDNAKGSGSVFYKYQDAFINDNYDLVLICIDTDRKRREYNIIKGKLLKMFGEEENIKMIIFSSPCIMQIILLHFEFVKLESQSKLEASPYIKKYIDFDGIYDAHDDQINKIMENINVDNYYYMKLNLESISTDEKITPSTNFLYFFNSLENDCIDWINNINKYL